MDVLSRVFVTVWTYPIEGPSGITNQPSIETEITCHPRCRLDAMVRRRMRVPVDRDH
jgi:hypothetical protein